MEGTGHHGQESLRPGDLAGALDWWRAAGVDLDFSDVAKPWLAPPEPAQPAHALRPTQPEAPSPEPEPQIGGDSSAWPADLARFAEWWLTEPSLDSGTVRGRVPPRGPAGAELMVVVGQPEAGDTADLLSGPEGRLLAAMLAAMRLAPDAVYFASALPRAMPVPDWAGLERRGLGAVLRHHVKLVAPRRLLVFGEGVLPLLGHDPAQSAQNSAAFYHEGQTIALLGARELGSLARPAWKARFWRDWLDWTGTETE